MEQYLQGNNMAPIKMADMRIRKFLILITPIRVKIQLTVKPVHSGHAT